MIEHWLTPLPQLLPPYSLTREAAPLLAENHWWLEVSNISLWILLHDNLMTTLHAITMPKYEDSDGSQRDATLVSVDTALSLCVGD